MNEPSSWRNRRLAQSEDIEPEYSHLPPGDEVRLIDYWNILVKRRRLLVLLFLAAFLPGAFYAATATMHYTASTTLKIEPQNPQVTGVAGLLPLDTGWGDYDYFRTQFALLKSRELAANVITDYKLASNQTFIGSGKRSPNPINHVRSALWNVLTTVFYYITFPFQPDKEFDDFELPNIKLGQDSRESKINPKLISHYIGLLNIAPVPKTRLVKLEFSTPHPRLSQFLANAHAEAFIRLSYERRFSLTKEARDYLNQKITELKEKLQNSETALNNFRREHGVVSVEKGENIVVDRLVDINKQLTTSRAQRIEAESLYRTVATKKHQDLAEVMRQGLVPQLKGNLASLEGEKSRLSTLFKPEHPRIQELSHQIEAARQALNNEIANVVKGIESSYAAALAKERSLEAEANKQQRDALKLKELGVEYTILLADANANRSLYESVFKRLSETHVSNDTALSNLQIVETAVKPTSPSSPNIPLYLLASLVSGLFFGIGGAFLRDYFDLSVSTPEVVWRSFGLNTLGVVPQFKVLNEQSHDKQGGPVDRPGLEQRCTGSSLLDNVPAKELNISHYPRSILSESYRTIRTSLLLSRRETFPQAILLTSAVSSEGKTTTSVNLSIALAQNGYPVILVDGDLRRGHCHIHLGMRNDRGLADVLRGAVSIYEAIQPTSITELSLLPRGLDTSQPTELLDSIKMREVLQELRRAFKFIVIDSPPVTVVNDAAVLSAISDGVLFVIDGQKTSKSSASRALDRLDALRSPLLGVILNRVNLNDPHYSYYKTHSSYYDIHPNIDWLFNGTNGNGSVKPTYRFKSIGKLAQLWGGQLNQQARHSTQRLSSKEELHQRTENILKSPATSKQVAEKNNQAISEAVTRQAAVVVEKDSQDNNFGTELLPQESLNRLIVAVTKSIGPIAPEVVREQIATLGESFGAFPKSRIGELVKLLQHEILQRTKTSSA